VRIRPERALKRSWFRVTVATSCFGGPPEANRCREEAHGHRAIVVVVRALGFRSRMFEAGGPDPDRRLNIE
tara:strand:- start:510 stop:722 length:213 start_codon:yes stop_codon:yes gene_type:complete